MSWAKPKLHRVAAALFLSALSGGVAPAHAQLALPALRPANFAEFQQNLDVYDWHYTLGHGGQVAGLRYAFGANILSSMIDFRDGERWKDQQIGYVTVARPIGFNSLLLTSLQYDNFSDELSAFNFDRRQAAATLAARITPFRHLHVQPQLGYRWESRLSLEENGAYGGLLVETAPFDWGGYSNRGYAWGEITQLRRRQNANARLRYTVSRQFSEDALDSLVVFYDFLRRDNRFSPQNLDRIESLRKQERGVSNYLQYGIGSNAVLWVETSLLFGKVSVAQLNDSRQVEQREHDDFRFENRARLLWRSPVLQNELVLAFTETSIKYNISDSAGFLPFSRPFASLGYDLVDKSTRIVNRLQYSPGFKNSYQLSFELAKLQHDNTALRDPDSYDEQRWQISIAHQHRLSSSLALRWELSTYLRHFIYLNRNLSSQNNWKRLLQLQPAVVFTPAPRVLFQQKAGVRAQYVAYDFDHLRVQKSSYVIRGFYIADSLVLPLASRIDASLYYRYELEELGSLNWSAFTSLPQTKLENHWLSLMFNHGISSLLRLSIGAMFYKQERGQFLAMQNGRLQSQRVGSHTNFGPVFQFLFSKKNGSVIYFSGQRQKAYPLRGEPYFLNHLQLSVQWRF